MKKLIFLIAFAVVAPVFADVPYIPPQSNQAVISQAAGNTPVTYSLNKNWQSYDANGRPYFDTQKANEYRKSPQYQSAQKSPGNTVTATKSHPTTFTDSYGNKASGTVRTQTRIANNAVAKGFGAIMVGTTATTHLDNLKRQGVADQISRGFSDGDWTAVAAGVGKIFDFTGFGSSVADAIYGDSTAAEAVAAPLREQALRQARTDFDNAQRQRQQIDPTATYTHVVVREWGGPIGSENIRSSDNAIVSEYIVKGAAPWGHGQMETKDWHNPTVNGMPIPNKLPAEKGYWMSINNTTISGKDAANIQAKINANIENYMPDQAAWEKAMEQFLNQSNANNAAITDLINALWQTGVINPQNTQTTVAGSAGDNTFVTDPYTPVGSDQAQQTQFQVNPDGSVTVSTIPRPDLPANSSVAPTRSEIGKPSNGNAQNQNPGQNQGQNQDQQNQNQSGSNRDNNICKANPKALMCMELGNTDYQDLKLPEQKVNLSFNPLNIFSSTGQCPPDTVFSIGHTTQTLSYRQICDAAVKMRPWVILFSMIVAFTIFRLTISRN